MSEEAEEAPPQWVIDFYKAHKQEQEKYNWRANARSDQLPPEWNWRMWLLRGGRGSGKTRAGAEWIRERWNAGLMKRGGLIAPSAAEVRDVIVEGESGILAVHPPQERPTFYPSKRRLEWPDGARATLYSADDPDQIRGANLDTAWVDELAKMREAQEVYDNLMLALRIGKRACGVVTTTPRPIPIIRRLAQDPNVAVSNASTYENLDNLSPNLREQVLEMYKGTRLERQEIYGEIIEDVEGALWSLAQIEQQRIWEQPKGLDKIVVAVDPPASTTAECGIVICGRKDDKGYILGDYSMTGQPSNWAKRVIQAYNHWNANYVVAEKNMGGAMVENTLRSADPDIPIRMVTASKGKVARAEPVSSLTEQGRLWHYGQSAPLEDQMTQFTGDKGQASPDRLDAMVWGITELLLKKKIRGITWGK